MLSRPVRRYGDSVDADQWQRPESDPFIDAVARENQVLERGPLYIFKQRSDGIGQAGIEVRTNDTEVL